MIFDDSRFLASPLLLILSPIQTTRSGSGKLHVHSEQMMCSGAQTARTVLERVLQGLHGQMHRSVCLPGFWPSCPAEGIYHVTTQSQHVSVAVLNNGRLKWTFVSPF